MDISESDRRQWEVEFEAASKRPLAERFKYAFIKTYKPVLDDAPYRSFESMAEYRRWCEENLPGWLGYGRAVDSASSADARCKVDARRASARWLLAPGS